MVTGKAFRSFFAPNGQTDNSSPTTILSLETDTPMTQSLPVDHESASPGRADSGLESLARRPNVDPCDVAEEAMPALVLGELSPPDASWLQGHVATCGYCHTMLRSFERCELVFDEATGHLSSAIPSGRPNTATALGMREAHYGFMDSPVGPLLVAATDTGVCEVSYLSHHDAYAPVHQLATRQILATERQASIAPAVEQLDDYFSGRRSHFDLEVDLHGITPFTRSVLDATKRVPFGQVTTYGRIAGEIGKARASRAVGNALGRNPIPIVIPCHRIVRSNGDLGWYTGGSEIKRSLLGIEGVKYDAPN